MKVLTYISGIFLLILGSCTSTRYSASEYDDLYYSSSDKPAAIAQPSGNQQIAEQNLSVNDYYDNMYAVDTLVSDQFNDAAQIDDQIIINNYGGGYDYYDNSYSGRLNMFYGNYFNPYWQDPFYFSMGYGYPYSGWGYGFGFGYPYFGLGFNYGFPYYGYGYGFGYGGYYGGYYPSYFGGYYPPYYYGGYYRGHGYDDSYINYGRRERASTMSSRSGNSMSAGGGYSRRDASLTSRASSSGGGSRSYSGTPAASTNTRRTDPSTGTAGVSKSAVSGRSSSGSQEAVKGTNARTGNGSQQGSSGARPEYKNSNRTYTPSYNNPRMSTRPSYNNSRTLGSEPGSRVNNSIERSSSTIKSVPSTSGGQRLPAYRSGSTGSGSGTYSVPARRSSDGGGSSSSGSYSRSSSGSSGYSGSGGRSSYSSGSSSYSSGSSSYSSGSSSGSSSHGSSGSSGRR